LGTGIDLHEGGGCSTWREDPALASSLFATTRQERGDFR